MKPPPPKDSAAYRNWLIQEERILLRSVRVAEEDPASTWEQYISALGDLEEVRRELQEGLPGSVAR